MSTHLAPAPVEAHRRGVELWAKAAAAIDAEGPRAAVPLLELGIEAGLAVEIAAAGLVECTERWGDSDVDDVVERAVSKLPTALHEIAGPVVAAIVEQVWHGIDVDDAATDLVARHGAEDVLGAVSLVSLVLLARVDDVLRPMSEEPEWGAAKRKKRRFLR